MSKQALLNINLLAARKGAAELEFAVKKVHSLDSSKGTPDGYIKAIEKRVEELVFEEVMKFQNEDNFLSIHKGHIENNSNVTWVLKPIDGVENFINGYPHFSISLCSMIDREIITAVVIDPIRREEFSASLGGGADLNNNKIRASKQNGLEDSMLSFKKSNKNNEFNFDIAYKELANQKLNMRESGCLSLDLSYVGAGRLDGVWGYDVSLIDFAAGGLIAQEGGALASNFKGDPKFLMENNIVSATSKIYKSILKSIKPNLIN
jgi:myo-inositol-1(or 4)-monophosphatase